MSFELFRNLWQMKEVLIGGVVWWRCLESVQCCENGEYQIQYQIIEVRFVEINTQCFNKKVLMCGSQVQKPN